ncbi:MAG TPA: hypothetical protein VFB07_02410 [Vicinamibacterales bacterium]|nr:hypothetical protein [Vicinamibacterales bacterium]
MTDDEYLWTRTGVPDDAVRELECLLERYRYREPFREAAAPTPRSAESADAAPDRESE